jgi:Ca2+-binding RTX toxin-like protein
MDKDTRISFMTSLPVTNLVIVGSGANESYKATSQIESFDGGAGIDTISYAGATSGVTLAFSNTDQYGVGNVTLSSVAAGGYEGIAQADQYANLEVFVGTSYQDRVYGADAGMTAYLGAGNDIFDNSHDSNAFDLLYGGVGNDTIWTGGGDDVVFGGQGNDNLYGENGNDVIYGGEGNDYFNGGNGNDTIYGGVGNDTINGDAGNAFLNGGDGDDRINGGTGNSTINGGNGNDYIIGLHAADVITGGAGNDTVGAYGGNDTVYGGEGNDYIAGYADDDRIFGGIGNDVLIGGAGNDTLTGGAGADQFVFNPQEYAVYESETAFGADRVTDFSFADGDRLILETGTTYTVADLGSSIAIDFGTGSVLLSGVGDFSADMIVFI